MYGFMLLNVMSGYLVYLELKDPNRIRTALASVIFMYLLSLLGLLLSL